MGRCSAGGSENDHRSCGRRKEIDVIEMETKTLDGKSITLYEAEVKKPDGKKIEIEVAEDGKLIKIKDD